MADYEVESLHAEVWDLLVRANVFIRGEFLFASGVKASLKVDMEKIYSNDDVYQRLLKIFANHEAVRRSDVLLYVPNGMKRFTHDLSKLIAKPVVNLKRANQGTDRYSFDFCSATDKLLAMSSIQPLICEDVVTTLGSVAGVRRLLNNSQQVTSLAILLRGEVEPSYKKGVDDFYLLQRWIPNDADQFTDLFGAIVA